MVSPSIENWIGVKSISGEELANKLKDHLESYRGENLTIIERTYAQKIDKTDAGFKVLNDKGDEFEGKTLLITTGSRRKKLNVPGATEFEHKGITYCATCDAPLFEGADVAVIGGGNAGFETASQLTAYAKSVTILHRNPEFKADRITVDKVLQNPKVKALANVDLVEVKGEKFANSLSYKDKGNGEIHELPIQGIFAEIGHEPNTDLVKGLVDTNDFGAIKTDARTGQTSQPGIWAAGDCTDSPYHQNNIAAGQGIVALEDIYNYILRS